MTEMNEIRSRSDEFGFSKQPRELYDLDLSYDARSMFNLLLNLADFRTGQSYHSMTDLGRMLFGKDYSDDHIRKKARAAVDELVEMGMVARSYRRDPKTGLDASPILTTQARSEYLPPIIRRGQLKGRSFEELKSRVAEGEFKFLRDAFADLASAENRTPPPPTPENSSPGGSNFTHREEEGGSGRNFTPPVGEKSPTIKEGNTEEKISSSSPILRPQHGEGIDMPSPASSLDREKDEEANLARARVREAMLADEGSNPDVEMESDCPADPQEVVAGEGMDPDASAGESLKDRVRQTLEEADDSSRTRKRDAGIAADAILDLCTALCLREGQHVTPPSGKTRTILRTKVRARIESLGPTSVRTGFLRCYKLVFELKRKWEEAKAAYEERPELCPPERARWLEKQVRDHYPNPDVWLRNHNLDLLQPEADQIPVDLEEKPWLKSPIESLDHFRKMIQHYRTDLERKASEGT